MPPSNASKPLRHTGIAHAVGGSFASSIHGIARATQDIDLIVDLPLARVKDLYEAIRREFYVDEDAMRDAIVRGMSFTSNPVSNSICSLRPDIRWVTNRSPTAPSRT